MSYIFSEKGKALLKESEGFRSKPYLCSAGVPTIGYGNTFYPNGRKVTMKDKEITEAEASVFLDFILKLFVKDVNTLVKGITLKQGQFDALVSFAYNLGSDIDADDIPEGLGDSKLLKKVKANPNDPSIKDEFMKWVNAGGKPVKGLITRRTKEVQLYFS
jgi:lysozyme